MNSEITISNTRLGERVSLNFMEKPFLRENVDLGYDFDFDIFGKPLDEYFSLPKGIAHATSLDYDENAKTAEFLATQLDHYRTSASSRKLQQSEILLYIYTLAEIQNHRFLFVTRIDTTFCYKTRKDWSFCLGFGEYGCCFRNYCEEFKLGNPVEVPDELLPELEILEKYCYFKEKYVDVTPSIWCYRLGEPPLQKKQPLQFGFRVKEDGVLGGLPYISQFTYGSIFETNLKEKKDWSLNPISFNCRELYSDLSEKSQFFAFIRDSLNTCWLIMALFQYELEPTENYSFKLLGCSFYF